MLFKHHNLLLVILNISFIFFFILIIFGRTHNVSSQSGSGSSSSDPSRMIEPGRISPPTTNFGFNAAVSNGIDRVAFTSFAVNDFGSDGGHIFILGYDRSFKTSIDIGNYLGTCGINMGGVPSQQDAIFATIPFDLAANVGTRIFRVSILTSFKTQLDLSTSFNFVRKIVSNFSLEHTFLLTDGNSTLLGANQWSPVLVLITNTPIQFRASLQLQYPNNITGSTTVNSHVVYSPATDQIVIISQTLPPII